MSFFPVRTVTFHILRQNELREAAQKQTYSISLSLFLSVPTDLFLHWISIYWSTVLRPFWSDTARLHFLALQQLLVRFWVREDSSGGIEFQAFGLDRYRSQTARLRLAPTALQFELLDTFRSATVHLNTVDIGFSPSNSTSHIWNTTANCPRAACVCRCVCLRNGMLAIILLTMSVCK